VKVLLLGGSGLVGSALRRAAPADAQVDAPSHATLDVTDVDALRSHVAAQRPQWIVNAVGFTATDDAERDPDRARALNTALPQSLVMLAREHGARVVHYSSDYVLGGARRTPWREDDAPAPLSVYGVSKAEGDRALLDAGVGALVLRPSWIFGDGPRCFPKRMWERARAGQTSRVVADQRGAPTHADDLAAWTWALMHRGAEGLYHATNAGETSWAEIAQRVYDRAGKPEGVTPVSSAEWGAAAMRPAYSVLDCAKLERTLGITRRRWDVALDAYLDTLMASAR
jgi:dTDP-4-dehydrorhamnose reductase